MMRTNTLPARCPSPRPRCQGLRPLVADSRIGISAIRPQAKRAAEDYRPGMPRGRLRSLSALTRFLYDIERDPLG